jgi:hypothetical protein
MNKGKALTANMINGMLDSFLSRSACPKLLASGILNFDAIEYEIGKILANYRRKSLSQNAKTAKLEMLICYTYLAQMSTPEVVY